MPAIVQPSKQRPDARVQDDGRPARIRLLVGQTELPVQEVAAMIGVGKRTLFRYMDDETPRAAWAPFPVQKTLELLVAFQRRVIGAREARKVRGKKPVQHA